MKPFEMPHFNLRHFLEKLGKEKGEDVFVLQIGAMDGKTFDPVHEFVTKFNWGGLMVEPVKERFHELQETYKEHSKILFENSAIAEHNGTTVMHYVPSEHVASGEVPNWGLGVTSFYTDRNALAFDNVKPLVESMEVPCITLPELLENHQVKHIDILQIDAEGYDYHVLKQLDFAKYKPKVINMEIVNLPKAEQTSVKKILDEQGYLYIKAGYDLLAINIAI